MTSKFGKAPAIFLTLAVLTALIGIGLCGAGVQREDQIGRAIIGAFLIIAGVIVGIVSFSWGLISSNRRNKRDSQ
jgi:hypothetical protein